MKDRKWTKHMITALVIMLKLLLLAVVTFGLVNIQTPGPLYHRPRLVMLLRAGIIFAALVRAYFVYIKDIRYLKWPLICTAIVGIFMTASFLLFPRYAVYTDVSAAGAEVFGGRKVMVIVPHQDDDINVCGGVLEQFIASGSEVYVVFATNGDFSGEGEIRLREALQCAEESGIPENHVFFLGYGDQWEDGSVHIYNMPEDQPMHSGIGKTHTYGIEEHPAYRDGNLYTFGNYLTDMADVIAQCRPELIFCVDYDSHTDHRATSLIAEKAIGRLLQHDPTYHPVVLKGFGYSTAWYAPEDFYSLNIKSTQAPSGAHMEEVNYYSWNQRLRLPVKADGLSRSIFTTSVYKNFYIYRSQLAIMHADRVCNGDKVYWQRSTDSLAYRARVCASSGNAGAVNDFMLHDCADLLHPSKGDGIWVPEKEDTVKQLTLELPEPRDVAWIYLYDNPSLTDNIEGAAILLEDGRRIEVEKLEPHGSAVKVPVDAHQAERITIEITKSQGDYAGLSEIELYEKEPEPVFHFIKLMDEQENFVYDYYMGADTMLLQLYRNGNAPALTPENYTLQLDNEKCSAYMEDGKIVFHCPRGQQCVLTVSSADGVYQDSVLLRNRFNLIPIAQKIEQLLSRQLLVKGAIYKISALSPLR